MKSRVSLENSYLGPINGGTLTGEPLLLSYGDFIDPLAVEQGAPSAAASRSIAAGAKPTAISDVRVNAPASPAVLPNPRVIQSPPTPRADIIIPPAQLTAAELTALRNRAMQYASGKIMENDRIRFIDVAEGRLIAAPAIPNNSDFEAAERMRAIEQLRLRTPYSVFTKTGAESSGTITINTDAADIVATATALLFPYVIVNVGVSALQGIANQQINVVFTALNQDGLALTTGTMTFEMLDTSKGLRFAITPWMLVSGKPVPVLGNLSATDTETSLVITNLPTDARASIMFPGTNHITVTGFSDAFRT